VSRGVVRKVGGIRSIGVFDPPRRGRPARHAAAMALLVLAVASLIAACGGTAAAKYVAAGRTACAAVYDYAVSMSGSGVDASSKQRDALGAGQAWASRTPPPDLAPQVAEDVRTWMDDGWMEALVNDPGVLEETCTRLLERVADSLDVPVQPLGSRTPPE
jgi:hypothetical protein